MKNPYFERVEIEQAIVESLFARHPELSAFINANYPFYVRVSKKPYPGLVHTIISNNATNEQVIMQWQLLNKICGKIKPKKIISIPQDKLEQIIGKEKASLIMLITKDVISKQLNLKRLVRQSQEEIIQALQNYPFINQDIINQFMLFTCFKQNVLCEQDADFIDGLKIFLSKQKIEEDDIKNIKIKYKDELTLFSLCMWRIKNEKRG